MKAPGLSGASPGSGDAGDPNWVGVGCDVAGAGCAVAVTVGLADAVGVGGSDAALGGCEGEGAGSVLAPIAGPSAGVGAGGSDTALAGKAPAVAISMTASNIAQARCARRISGAPETCSVCRGADFENME